MGWEEKVAKVVNRIFEKFSRIGHPKTKTFSDLIIEHYKVKALAIEKEYAKLSKEDLLHEPTIFLERLEKI